MDKASADDSGLNRFFDQFEADGGGYLYRRHGTGPGYRVTADERDALVAAFSRRRRWFGAAMLAIFVGYFAALFLAPSWFARVDALADKQWLPPYFALLAMSYVGKRVIAAHMAWTLVRDRAPVAPALPPAERRRLRLGQLPDTVLVGTATITICVLLFFALERPAIDWPKLLVIVGCGVALVWALVQGVRKWQLERTYAASNLT